MPSPAFWNVFPIECPNNETVKIMRSAIPAIIKLYSIEVAPEVLRKKFEKDWTDLGDFEFDFSNFRGVVDIMTQTFRVND